MLSTSDSTSLDSTGAAPGVISFFGCCCCNGDGEGGGGESKKLGLSQNEGGASAFMDIRGTILPVIGIIGRCWDGFFGG